MSPASLALSFSLHLYPQLALWARRIPPASPAELHVALAARHDQDRALTQISRSQKACSLSTMRKGRVSPGPFHVSPLG